jgi:PleD family two-component response regulator
LKITVSIGVSTLGAADDADSFFRRTDDALLEAKRSGRNCVVHR